MSAILRISWHSKILLRPVEIMAAMPPGVSQEKKAVLWALHCAMEDGSYFFNYLDAARLAHALDIAIIAPGLGNGFFLNTAYEPQGDFLEELADSLPSILNISRERNKNAILGVSMGGFGSIRWALESRRFFAAAAISGAFDATLPPDERFRQNEKMAEIQKNFGALMLARLSDPAGNLPYGGSLRGIVEKYEGNWPRLLFYCGGEDYLSLPQTETFYSLCKSRNAPCELFKSETGGHDIDYWRKAFPAAATAIYGKRKTPGQRSHSPNGSPKPL